MRAIMLIFAAATIWAGSGIVVGWGLSSLYGLNWLVECGSLNLALGMLLIQIITRSEAGRRLFYEGIQKEEDQLHLGIAVLWALPVSMLLAGVLWWLSSKIFPPLP